MEDTLKFGDSVLCLKTVYFCDGTSHVAGARYTVTKDTIYYCSLFYGKDYGFKRSENIL